MNPRHQSAVVLGLAWLAACAPARAHELHGYFTVVSDYVFRGVSQSEEDPTVQAGIDYLHPVGIFAGAFVARTDFPGSPFGSNPGAVEFDAYLGFGRASGGDWAWDVAALSYEFPESTGFDYSYQELAANLHFRDILRLGATVSDDAAASSASGWTVEIELRRPLGDRFQLSGSLGHCEFERTDWGDYRYWDIGVSTVAGPVTFDLRYFDTSGDVAASFLDPSLARAR
ncbi:MAG: TorF family putative porin, partial [Steroidobacteraceae bacterium]